MKRFGLIILTAFLLSTLVLAYQNCAGQSGPGLQIGNGPSGGCPQGQYLIASSNTCSACQYGYNSTDRVCYPPPVVGAKPSFSCSRIPSTVGATPIACPSYPEGTTSPTPCIVQCGEKLKCDARSNVSPDSLFGCDPSSGTCIYSLNGRPDWTYTPGSPGSYSYEKINDHNGTDTEPAPWRVGDSRTPPVKSDIVWISHKGLCAGGGDPGSEQLVGNPNKTTSNGFCVDDTPYMKFAYEGGELVLKAYGTSPGGNIGQNCSSFYSSEKVIWKKVLPAAPTSIKISGSIGGTTCDIVSFTNLTVALNTNFSTALQTAGLRSLNGLCGANSSQKLAYNFTVTAASYTSAQVSGTETHVSLP